MRDPENHPFHPKHVIGFASGLMSGLIVAVIGLVAQECITRGKARSR
jgi:hypothetical protein